MHSSKSLSSDFLINSRSNSNSCRKSFRNFLKFPTGIFPEFPVRTFLWRNFSKSSQLLEHFLWKFFQGGYLAISGNCPINLAKISPGVFQKVHQRLHSEILQELRKLWKPEIFKEIYLMESKGFFEETFATISGKTNRESFWKSLQTIS